MRGWPPLVVDLTRIQVHRSDDWRPLPKQVKPTVCFGPTEFHVADLHLIGTYTTANFAIQNDCVRAMLVSLVPCCTVGGSRSATGYDLI